MLAELWIARDKSGKLFLYMNCPKRTYNRIWLDHKDRDMMEINKELYPEVKWTDEPVRAELIIKK